jgi:hypothetical protein
MFDSVERQIYTPSSRLFATSHIRTAERCYCTSAFASGDSNVSIRRQIGVYSSLVRMNPPRKFCTTVLRSERLCIRIRYRGDRWNDRNGCARFLNRFWTVGDR